MIENTLTLSTAHMPESNPNFQGVRDLKYKYGYIVFATQGEQVFCLPEWLRPIMKHAIKHECTLIMFDCDAAIQCQFKTYEW